MFFFEDYAKSEFFDCLKNNSMWYVIVNEEDITVNGSNGKLDRNYNTNNN